MLGHPVGRPHPPLLPPRSGVHPLFGPRAPPVAPPHEGYQRADHRWYLALQPFKFKVVHRPGVQMAVAGFLSRNGGAAGRRAHRPETGGGGMWRGGHGNGEHAEGRAGSETSGETVGK